jgi:HNH endonuclease
MTHLTAKRLRRLLHYNEKTGEFTWLKSQGRVKAGARAGCFCDSDGTWRIGVAGRLYKRARLAVLWNTGEWPRQEVVHRNGDPADDRWCNLREATHSQMVANRGVQRNNTTGFKGVSPSKNGFMAKIKKDGKSIYLGYYRTPEEAHAAYCAMARRLHGEFASFE